MSENKFKTKVKIEIDYKSEKPKDFEYDSRISESFIEYFISLDIREWGIKNIDVYSLKQDIEIELSLSSEKSEEVEEYSFKIEIESISVEIDDVSLNSSVCPKELNLQLTDIKQIKSKIFTASAKGILIF